MNVPSEEPTGRVRYRVERKWFGRAFVVLQIEVKGTEFGHYCGRVEVEHYQRWRDAKVTDLTVEMMS